jgi:signal peptidase II
MMRAARASGLAIAAIAVALDQAHKAWMLGPFALPDKGRVTLTPFLDLVMVWNRGISYGLLSQEGGAGRLVLIVIGLAGAVLFGWWLWSTRGLLAAASLGLVIGGALSNVIDRVRHGAVADFFLFHAGSFEWYVFNLADVWIVAGVMGLMLSWAMERPEKAKAA